jgi:hypothetical protein
VLARIEIAGAEKISDPTLRRSFLEWVAVNREIVEKAKANPSI